MAPRAFPRRVACAILLSVVCAAGPVLAQAARPGGETGLVAHQYLYSWMLLGGQEEFRRECARGAAFRSETAGRILSSMDSRKSTAPVGFDALAMPDSLADPARIEQVTLVDAAAGRYVRLDPRQHHEFTYPFDPLHLPDCPRITWLEHEPAPVDTTSPTRLPDDRLVGRVAHHYQVRERMEGAARDLAMFPLKLAGLEDSPAAVYRVADVWTCPPDRLLARWRDAHGAVPFLMELDPDTSYRRDFRPFACRDPERQRGTLPPRLPGIPDSEIVVGFDLSDQFDIPGVDTTVAGALARLPRDPGGSAVPFVWRNGACYQLRWRLLDVAEAPLAAELFQVPPGYEVLNADDADLSRRAAERAVGQQSPPAQPPRHAPPPAPRAPRPTRGR